MVKCTFHRSGIECCGRTVIYQSYLTSPCLSRVPYLVPVRNRGNSPRRRRRAVGLQADSGKGQVPYPLQKLGTRISGTVSPGAASPWLMRAHSSCYRTCPTFIVLTRDEAPSTPSMRHGRKSVIPCSSWWRAWWGDNTWRWRDEDMLL